MKVFIVVIVSGFLCTSAHPSPERPKVRASNGKVQNPAKRDISLSYAATDIDSREGTRVKTITVIKNLGDNDKNKLLSINPELHKNEEWGSTFRDNFDSYGKLPDVPDIDDLFEFVHKKKAKESEEDKTESSEMKMNPSMGTEKPAKKDSAEAKETSSAEVEVEKIKGDAEIIPRNNSGRSSPSKSQSLHVEKYQVHESPIDVNFSTPNQSMRQRFGKFIVLNANKNYDYQKPCVQSSQGSATVATPSGRSYDIPVNKNNNSDRPYIAPAIAKKTQVQPTNNQPPSSTRSPPAFSINSVVPLQRPQAAGNVGAAVFPPIPALPPPQGSSAFPATNLRNGLGISRGPPSVHIYRGGQSDFRPNGFGTGTANRPNFGRSRGLKY